MSSSEDALAGGEGTSTSTRKTLKRVKYSQKYRQDWENDESFKGWIRQGKTDSEAYCTVCNKSINISSTGKTILLRHKESALHLKLAKSAKKQQTLTSMSTFKKTSSLEVAAKKADLHLAAYVAEHNISYNAVEHLPKLIRQMCPDSDIAKQLKCGRTKCSSLVKNVIGKQSETDVINILRSNKFSLIIDESTDRSCTKHLALICRYFQNGRIRDTFLTLVPMKDARAQDIFGKIITYFEDKEIPYEENLIGFASDGANVMTGKYNSVMSRLKERVNNIFLMRCICHSFHLCASAACEKLPRGVEDIVRDIYNYFSNSPKRIEVLKDFQSFTHTKIHKILHPAQTRWLSLESVVVRLLEQYDALILFFVDAVTAERLLAAETILTRLRDPLTKCFLQFLEFVLPFFTNMNREMQSSEPKIHKIHAHLSAIYKSVLECFIKRHIINITPLEKIEFNNPHNYLPLNDIYLGAKVSLSENNLASEQIHILRTRCLDFFVESCVQFNKRFDFSNNVLKKLEIIDPRHVLEGITPSIVPLARHFPNLVQESKLQILDNEWRLLRNTKIDFDPAARIEQFWVSVKNMCFGDNSPMFLTLSDFVLALLCLPHSSANVERIFSQINLLKTKQRNKLSTASIVGLLHSKNYLGVKDESCYSFDTKEVIKLHNSQMYKKTTEHSELTGSESE